jgi:hypothetical protein
MKLAKEQTVEYEYLTLSLEEVTGRLLDRMLGVKPATGDRFGELTLTGQYGSLRRHCAASSTGFKHFLMCECRCQCGSVGHYRWTLLKRGDTRSCGCLSYEFKARLHRGKSKYANPEDLKSPLYHVWSSMKSRCNTPTHDAYARYGGR